MGFLAQNMSVTLKTWVIERDARGLIDDYDEIDENKEYGVHLPEDNTEFFKELPERFDLDSTEEYDVVIYHEVVDSIGIVRT